MKKTTDLSGTSKGYKVFSVAILVVMVIFFLFPLYWIVTGSFKNKLEITARTPIWFPIEPTVENYARLFDNPAFLWLFNIIFISAAAMILTCLTASLAGYALGKKRFIGRGVLFTIIICAMALPKQVIVIPLAQEMTNFWRTAPFPSKRLPTRSSGPPPFRFRLHYNRSFLLRCQLFQGSNNSFSSGGCCCRTGTSPAAPPSRRFASCRSTGRCCRIGSGM